VATTIPLALYVHLPWCVAKCPYCDFVSHELPRDGLPEQRYVTALLDDLEFASRAATGRAIVSVFFGGGTPSLFSAQSIDQVLTRARELLPFVDDVEITLEANPGTIEHGRFDEYRAVGVNRVSLGAQSFDDRQLSRLGRIHRADETRRAVDELRLAGLDNFNLDLMYALPEQDLEGALRDVALAIELGPTHISHYQLTLEPGTVFARHPPPLPAHDASYDMQVACQDRLAAAGYAQYEISGYARPGARCRHNLNYWTFGDYVGVGVGAHGKVTSPAGERIERTERTKSPARYLAAEAPAERIADRHAIVPGQRAFEFCLNALRLVDGFEWRVFEARTGLSRETLATTCEQCERDGLLTPMKDLVGWRPTPKGLQFLNDLQARFMP
jgi:oxygen-independent coproporphyrinogen-3 oxidase